MLVGELGWGVGPGVSMSRFKLRGTGEHRGIDAQSISSGDVADSQYLKEFAALV